MYLLASALAVVFASCDGGGAAFQPGDALADAGPGDAGAVAAETGAETSHRSDVAFIPADGGPAAGSPVAGTLIQAGSNFHNIQILSYQGQPWVLFEVETATLGHGGIPLTEVYFVRLADPTERRLLLRGRARDAASRWSVPVDASGARYYLTNVRSIGGPGLTAGMLYRVGLDGTADRIDEVTDVDVVDQGRVLNYGRYVRPATRVQERHLRDLATGKDRSFGAVAARVRENQHGLWLLEASDPHYVLLRLPSFDAVPQIVRNDVNKYGLHGGHVVLDVGAGAERKVVALDFTDGSARETALPQIHPERWVTTDEGPVITFYDAADAVTPARLHQLDLDTGKQVTMVLPAGFTDVDRVWQPRARPQEWWVFSRESQVAIARPDAPPQLLNVRINFYRQDFDLSADGRQLVFASADPFVAAQALGARGRLYALDAPAWQTPRPLSPREIEVPLRGGHFMRAEGPWPLVYWGLNHDDATDLYVGDPGTGVTQRIAERIGWTTFSGSHFFGVVDRDGSGAGRLVRRDFITGEEALLERQVTSFTTGQGHVVFQVLEVDDPSSPRNGLWVTMMP